MTDKFDIVQNHMKELSELYFRLDEVSRGTTFQTVAKLLEDTFPDKVLPSDINSLKALRGVGPSTIKEVSEVLEKGTSDRLESLKERISNTEISTNDIKSKLKGILNHD